MAITKTLNFISIEVKNKLRTNSFLRLLFIAVFIPFFIFPNEHLLLNALLIEPEIYAQFSHSSWCSIAVSFCASLMFVIFCMIYSKNSLYSDKSKYPVIFISRMSHISYVLGKYIANILMTLIVFLFLIIGTLFVALTNFPLAEFSLYSFLSPFIVLIPSCFFVIALTNLMDIIFNNKKVGTFGSIALITLLAVTTFPTTPLGDKFDIAGALKIRESIEMAGFNATGIPLEKIMVLGNVSDDMMIGNKILVLNGLYDFKGALVSGLFIVLASFIIIFIASLIFLAKNKYFDFTKVKRGKIIQVNDSKSTILFLLVRSNNTFINLVIMRLHSQLKDNKTMILSFFIINILGSILIDFEFFQLIIYPMSFILISRLLSSLGTQDHKNNFLMIFNNLLNRKLLLHSSVLSTFILITFASFPSFIKMFALKQFISIITVITLIVFFIAFASILAEVTKESKTFQILYILLIYIITVQPNVIIGIAPDYTGWTKLTYLFSVSFAMLIIANIFRARSEFKEVV